MSQFTGASLQALCDLLKNPSQQEDSDSEDERPRSYQSKIGPGSIGPQKKAESDVASEGTARSLGKGSRQPVNAKNIWADDEVAEGAEFDDTCDPRPSPQYEILYKQAVSAEDMYLQMGNKTPATSSCEEVVIKVMLPGTRYADINVDLKDKFLSVRSPKFKLGLHLPHPVDSKNGRARWDGDKEFLAVTARMVREYDFVNF